MYCLWTSLFLLLIWPRESYTQLSDIISVQKKNGKILKTFVKGSPITFETQEGNEVLGHIEMIRDDSLFIISHDVRYITTPAGFTFIDTAGTYRSGWRYTDLSRVKISDKSRFLRNNAGRLVMLGGAGYFVLNLVNNSYLKIPFSDGRNLQTLAFSAGAAGAGWFIQRHLPTDNFSRSKHRIIYVNLR